MKHFVAVAVVMLAAMAVGQDCEDSPLCTNFLSEHPTLDECRTAVDLWKWGDNILMTRRWDRMTFLVICIADADYRKDKSYPEYNLLRHRYARREHFLLHRFFDDHPELKHQFEVEEKTKWEAEGEH